MHLLVESVIINFLHPVGMHLLVPIHDILKYVTLIVFNAESIQYILKLIAEFLPKDASLRDAEIICIGFLPKDASLRDAKMICVGKNTGTRADSSSSIVGRPRYPMGRSALNQ